MRGMFGVGAAAMLALSAGCGGSKIVPVSGTVYLDGQPCANVVVSFQPLATDGDINPGRGSSAITDANGRYSLVYDGEKPGALTGKHRVRIFPNTGSGPGVNDGEPVKDVKPSKPPVRIPPEWNDLSTKEFDVPSGGTDKADFSIESKPSK